MKTPSAERLKPALRWQSYLLAFVMVVGFFIFTQSVMAESKTETTPAVGLADLPAPAALETGASKAELAVTALSADRIEPEAATPLSEVFPQTGAAEAGEGVSVGPRQEPEEIEFASAQSVVTEFYRELNAGDFGQAYDKLSPDFRESLSYHRFNEGYSSTSAISCTIRHSEKLNDDLVRFDIAISATEGGVESLYYATCLVRKLADSWWLDGVGQVRG